MTSRDDAIFAASPVDQMTSDETSAHRDGAVGAPNNRYARNPKERQLGNDGERRINTNS